ncbi:MAG: glycerate kinase [Burkholderiales bacterium]|nr:glycerate kinase [Burkholderiales bacterium]OUT77543.1 MAG: glycerate kinase [Betaproteobacteria bacterium TMED22]|tara:strand:- start:33923 stop:35182 length:1260 start_codon:yes stop_codon:yes gene_type:complete
MKHKKFLNELFDVAINAALPEHTIKEYLPDPPTGRTVVIGCGKAAATMAVAFEKAWDAPVEGVVVTRYGHKVPTQFIEVREASHPIPDEAGMAAAIEIQALIVNLTSNDLVVFLVSGGGSSLLTLPAEGISLEDKKMLNTKLLQSGANIREMNCVRKHLSAVKGGRLAEAISPAQCVTLAISDIPGDDLSVIASGPTEPDETTFNDAQAILTKYRINEPKSIMNFLGADKPETPKPDNPVFKNMRSHLIATPQHSLEAAARFARIRGFTPLILGDAIEGEAREVARVLAGITKQVVRHNQPAQKPCVLLSGGETTVTVNGSGRGGRNAEFLLSLALELNGLDGVWAFAGDTDGIDGTEDNAGALITPDSLKRAGEIGLDAKLMLADNDGYSFFKQLNDLVITGPTLTNVNDFRAIVIDN